MRRRSVLTVAALVLAIGAGPILAQEDLEQRSDGGLNLTVTLEDVSDAGRAARTLELPTDEGARPSPSASGPGRFQPADFAGPNRFEAMEIEPDDLPDRTKIAGVRCQALIDGDGTLGAYFCSPPYIYRIDRHVVNAVISIVPTQQFVGARVDGENVRVLMNFAVYVDCRPGSCFAVATRNHGYDAERLGLDYVDPQPILENDDWYDGFEHKLRWIRGWMPQITRNDWDALDSVFRYVMAAEVDVNGVAGPGCVYWVGNRAVGADWLMNSGIAAEIKSAVASLGNVRYVPGMVDGGPATLRFYEESVATYNPPGFANAVLDGHCE